MTTPDTEAQQTAAQAVYEQAVNVAMAEYDAIEPLLMRSVNLKRLIQSGCLLIGRTPPEKYLFQSNTKLSPYGPNPPAGRK